MTANTNDKRPSHIIWMVKGDNDKARWTPIGAGWPNRDNKGLSLVFDAYPVSGRVVIREFTEHNEGGAQ